MFDTSPAALRASLLVTSAVVLAVGVGACANLDHAPLSAAQIEASSLGAKPIAIEWPVEDWWRRYDDTQLDALIADGIKGAPTLAAARARIARADAAAGVARGALLPEVSGNANSLYQRYSENYIFPPPLGGSWKSDNRLTLDFSYEIDFWNKNRSAHEAALSQAQAAVADEQAARLVLATNIARAYFDLQRLFAQRDVSLAAITQR